MIFSREEDAADDLVRAMMDSIEAKTKLDASRDNERRQSPPSALQNVVASYVRDGHPQEDAEREAQKWQERMGRRKAEIDQKKS